MKLINLTPHPITLRLPDGTDMTLASEGVARVATIPGALRDHYGIPVPTYASPAYGEVEGLPGPVEGTAYVVSLMVLARCQGRRDVYAPGTGPVDGAIRDDKGNVVAVTRLIAAP